MLQEENKPIDDALEKSEKLSEVPEALRVLSLTITERRQELKLKQNELAFRVGCHSSFIAKIENLRLDSPLPSYTRTAKLEEVLGMKGQLWTLVTAAKDEMEHYRLQLRTQDNQNRRQARGSEVQMAAMLGAKEFPTTELNSTGERVLKEIWGDLIITLNNEADSLMLRTIVRGLAAKSRELPR